MFDQKVIISEQFPISQKARKHTDVCCTIVGAVFAISLLITALIVYSPEKYAQRFTPFLRNPCKTGYLHIPDIKSNPKNIVCVEGCPQGYGGIEDRMCVSQNIDQQLRFYKERGIIREKNHEGFSQSLTYSLVVSLGVGLLWIGLVFAAANYAPFIAGICGIFSLILVVVFSVLSTEEFWGQLLILKWFPVGVSSMLIVILIGMVFFYSGQLKFQAVMLKYSNIFLFQNYLTFIYIQIFLILIWGLLALIWFQNMAFQSRFAQDNNSLNYRNSGILSYLNLIQLLWGLQFLRDSFYFCVSGNAVDWYWKGQCSTFSSMMRLLFRHWGSVVGGSFLNAFFQIPALFAQLFTCHPETCCSKSGTICINSCNTLTCFFQIIRTDAYSYINLSGIPFCNSARNCSYICQKSKQFVGNNSAIKHYRFMAFVFLTSLLCFMMQWILNYRTFNVCPCNLAIGVVTIYANIAFFIDIHASSAQALQTCYFIELELEEGYKYMRKIQPSIRAELQFLDYQPKEDGNC